MINQSTRRSLLTALATIPAVAAAGQAEAAYSPTRDEKNSWDRDIRLGDVVVATNRKTGLPDGPMTVEYANKHVVGTVWFDGRNLYRFEWERMDYSFRRWLPVGRAV